MAEGHVEGVGLREVPDASIRAQRGRRQQIRGGGAVLRIRCAHPLSRHRLPCSPLVACRYLRLQRVQLAGYISTCRASCDDSGRRDAYTW